MDLCEVTDNSNRHPWELSRGRCILKEIKRVKNVERVLDIGCGDGYFDRVLINSDNRVRTLLGYDLYFKEIHKEGNCTWTNRFEDIPDNYFDLILMMDVLEHVEDDYTFFQKICCKLGPTGRILITVPAFMKLFSVHDVELKHFRRYNRRTLSELVELSHCQIYSQSYFYASLIVMRLLTKNRTENLGTWKYSRDHYVTRLVEILLNIDFDFLRSLSKMKIYIGGLSLMMIVGKKNNE